ncbi:MAG: ORF6N domain-containing protein [Verrucomicrobia bacterium]|nr:ORF6N domain-containing protein [Verrucomicrobiota bacterium]
MAYETAIQRARKIENLILTVRGQRVMLDSDLARIYGVSTRQLNQQLKRNSHRFPKDFAFQLTPQELACLMSQIVTSKPARGGRRKLPWVFTEHGAIMLASVLNSPVAVQASVRVVRAFVFMREQLTKAGQLGAAEVMRKLAELEGRVGQHDEAIRLIFTALRQLLEPPPAADDEPKRPIGFQVRETGRPYVVRPRRFSDN